MSITCAGTVLRFVINGVHYKSTESTAKRFKSEHLQRIQQWIDCDVSKDAVPVEKSLPMKTQAIPWSRTGQSSPMLTP